MDWPLAVSIIAVVVSVSGLTLTHFRTKTSVEQGERITKLETKVELFWVLLEQNMAKILHRPTHREMDELLEKRERLEPLEEHEATKLEGMLRAMIDDRSQSRDLRMAAAQMLAARQARRATA